MRKKLIKIFILRRSGYLFKRIFIRCLSIFIIFSSLCFSHLNCKKKKSSILSELCVLDLEIFTSPYKRRCKHIKIFWNKLMTALMVYLFVCFFFIEKTKKNAVDGILLNCCIWNSTPSLFIDNVWNKYR